MKTKALLLIAVLSLFAVAAFAAPQRKEWVVKKGDTLGQIVFTLRAEGIDVKKLHDWNPDLGTQVQVGQRIVYYLPETPLPAVSSKQARAEADKVLDQLAQTNANQKSLDRKINWTLVLLVMLAAGGLTACGVLVRRIRKGQRTMETVSPIATPQPKIQREVAPPHPAAFKVPELSVDAPESEIDALAKQTLLVRFPFKTVVDYEVPGSPKKESKTIEGIVERDKDTHEWIYVFGKHRALRRRRRQAALAALEEEMSRTTENSMDRDSGPTMTIQ